MKYQLLIILAAMSLLTACEYITGEPNANTIKMAVAELHHIDPGTITDFKKESCWAGAVSFMYRCKFNFKVMKDGKAVHSDINEARFVSQDGSTWTAYKK